MKACFVLLSAAVLSFAADLSLLPEHGRPDPFGAIVRADRAANVQPSRSLKLEAPRASYVSCHLLVSLPEGGPYRLTVSSPLATDLYREWFHYLPASKSYYPDALMPVASPYRSELPEPDNRVPKQTVQSFWLDIWVPADARAGDYRITATLDADATPASAAIDVRVLPALVPDTDPVVMDHNSYGTSWFASQYPAMAQRVGAGFYLSDQFFGLIHSYHRIFHEHRGVYHQLGYGHGGKVGPEFAPRLEGSGRSRHIADWTQFDRHYGPLLDGSAFATTRRGPRPIPFVYLPVNPEWPASQLWWGEPGYEREFVNVVAEMERHFREKGWTRSKFELFFNHKKRYKAFFWDGDETRFIKDMPVLCEYARWLKLAVPAGTPVQFLFRADASWQMERQFKELAGIINFWVCGGGLFGWYADQLATLKKRGDMVWIYGNSPGVESPAAQVTVEVLRPWILGVDGFVRWQTVLPGPDPWFQFAGGGETMVYPGDRFGIPGPLASIRLKLQRNALQDLALLDSFGTARSPGALRAEAARRFNHTRPDEWRAPRPPMANTNPEEWTNRSLDEVLPDDPRFGARLDAGAWQRVRDYALTLAREARP